MLKKKPIIFATGCSFTDPEFFSRHEHLPDEKRGGWSAWPYFIKERIEKETGISYELINLARSGGSNDWVYNTCLDTISKYDERVKIILIGGTEWMRSHIIPPQRNYQPFAKIDSWHKNDPHWKWLIPQSQATMEMWAQWSTTFGIQEVIYHNLRHMWTLTQIFNDKKIKFIWNQLLNPLPAYNIFKEEILEYGIPEEELRIEKRAFEKQFFVDTILKSPYAKLLVKNKKQFYGFPWSQGSYWENYIWEEKPLFEAMVMPPTIIDNKKVADVHPNAFGHKQIALQMWERYGNYLVKN